MIKVRTRVSERHVSLLVELDCALELSLTGRNSCFGSSLLTLGLKSFLNIDVRLLAEEVGEVMAADCGDMAGCNSVFVKSCDCKVGSIGKKQDK